MSTTTKPPANPVELTGSRHILGWLHEQRVSLVFTTYQSCRLLLMGLHENGRLSAFERLFDRAMGLYATPERLYMSSRFQLWRFENMLAPGETHNGYDKLYVPRAGYTTGDLDTHDIVLASAPGFESGPEPALVFVNTQFNCLATLSTRHSFRPLWKPPFISKWIGEDRCHLNGLALAGGRPRYVTAVSRSDVVDGWRDRRRDGGVVIDVGSNEIVAGGLSMPHSPRFYRDRLWLLNSGTGEFGTVDLADGRFEPVVFCPGYARGLAFWRQYAIIGLSRARESTFTGLALDEQLSARDTEARCGLLIVDLDSGDVAHWIRLEGVITELYDVQVLPGVRKPTALGFQSDEIANRMWMEPPVQGTGIRNTAPSVPIPDP